MQAESLADLVLMTQKLGLAGEVAMHPVA